MTTNLPYTGVAKLLIMLEKIPLVRQLRDVQIGHRLTFSFGILVILTLFAVGFSYFGSVPATNIIDQTNTVRVPTALVASNAQADLLEMLGDVRAYLALGDKTYRDSYLQVRQDFEMDLAELEALSADLSPENQTRLQTLKEVFAEWSTLPEELFALRDDQLAREPAYRLLATGGLRIGGLLLLDVGAMIRTQSREVPSENNLAILTDLAEFQGSFASMVSGLRGYVTTRNRDYKVEYRGNLTVNSQAWERLLDKRALLSSAQQEILDDIAQKREAFLALPDEIFTLLESDGWRQDLFLFRTKAVPLTQEMEALLTKITQSQQRLLQTDLKEGRNSLLRANQQIVMAGVIALLLGIILSVVFRESIVGPIRRLTFVAEQIRQGDFNAQALIESKDETGILASTFNNMTRKLRDTLTQVRKEKNRADSLLDVVIPIGVDLTTEKDFNRLLERMLFEAKDFCKADAGILYLLEEDNLRPVIIRNTSLDIAMGGTTGNEIKLTALPLQSEQGTYVSVQAALSEEPVNIADVRQMKQIMAPETFNGHTGYEAKSFLSLPLLNSEDKVIGVLELINAQDSEDKTIIAFDENLQQMMQSFSSLAVAALEAYAREQQLKQEIQRLRVEIDEAKKEQQVKRIVESETFKDIQAKADAFRERHQRPRRKRSSEG